jgi:hypothetical protein
LERARKRGGRVVHRFGGGSARQAAEAVVNSVFLPTDSAEDPKKLCRDFIRKTIEQRLIFLFGIPQIQDSATLRIA